MIHEVLPVGVLQCNCSVIGDEATRESIVIDPGDDIADIADILKRHGLTVKMIVITHAHIDHIGGAHKLRALTGAPVYMNEADTFLADNLAMQAARSEEHTSELQSPCNLVCRLLLEKKKNKQLINSGCK